MFNGLVAFFIFLTLLCSFSLIATIWLCYVAFSYYRHEDVLIDSLIEDAYDANDQTFEMEIIGNPNVEVMIDFIILTLNL